MNQIIRIRSPHLLVLMCLALLGLALFRPTPPGNDRAQADDRPPVAMDSVAFPEGRAAEAGGDSTVGETSLDNPVFGLLETYRLEDLLARSVDASPMWEAEVTEILDHRIRETDPGVYDVDIVFEASDHAVPVRMASTVSQGADGELTTVWRGTYHAGEAIARLGEDADALESVRAVHEVDGFIEEFGIFRVVLPTIKIDEADAHVEILRSAAGVDLATMHDLVFPAAAPNDPAYPSQGNLRRIDPEFAWSLMPDGAVTPSGRVITITAVDNGHDLNDPDLSIWVNEGEVLDGTDSDGNGWVDDIHGWHFGLRSNNVNTRSGHGSQVARIAGAINNNGIGGASPAGYVQVIPAVYSSSGSGSLFAALDATRYGIINGAVVINFSFIGGGGDLWGGIFRNVRTHGIYNVIFIAAAGNNGRDLAEFPAYPAASLEPNVISVGSSTLSDTKVGNSNYGKHLLDLFAPGGATSWSTPMVSSAAALLFAVRDDVHWEEVRDWLLDGVDRVPALEPYCITGGRLNLSRSVALSMGVEYGDIGGSEPAPDPEPAPEPEPQPEPEVPALSLIAVEAEALTLRWDVAEAVDQIELAWGVDATQWETLESVEADALSGSVIVEGLESGATHFIRARAHRGGTAGDWSVPLEVFIPTADSPPSDGGSGADPDEPAFVGLEPIEMVRWVNTPEFLVGVSADSAWRGEGLDQLVDGNATTKWLAVSPRPVFEFEFHNQAGRVVEAIVLVSGNDRPERDPSFLEFVSHATGERVAVTVPGFSQRREERVVPIEPTLSGDCWRLYMHNTSGDITQLSQLSFVFRDSEEEGSETLASWLEREGYPRDTDPRTPCPRWNGTPLGLVYAFALSKASDDGDPDEWLAPTGAVPEDETPRLPRVVASAGGVSEFVFWRDRTAPDVVLDLEGSADLRAWTVLAELGADHPIPADDALQIEDRGNGRDRVAWRFTAAEGELRFFRVTVRFAGP